MSAELRAAWHHKSSARAGIVSTFAGTGTTMTLRALLDLQGAAWGVAARQALSAAVFAAAFSRVFGSLARIVSFGRISLAASPADALLWWASTFELRVVVGLVIATIVAMVLFGTALCLLRVLPWPPRGF